MDMPLGAIQELKTLSRSERHLSQIADALGLPIDALKDPRQLTQELGAAELLRLWLAIKSEQGRDAALAGVKAIVDAQAD